MSLRNLLISTIVIAGVVAPNATFAAAKPAHVHHTSTQVHHTAVARHTAAKRGAVRGHTVARGVWLGKHKNARHVVRHGAVQHSARHAAKKHTAARHVVKTHTAARHAARKHTTRKK